MINYNCIIIDDYEIDRLLITAFVKRFSFLNIVGACATAKEALKIIETEKIDVLFLDIDMPEINGLEFRKQVLNIPACIYVTAYPEHALDSFELDTLDFIVKPVKFDRFSQSIKRLEIFLNLHQKASLLNASLGADTILIKDGNQQIKIKMQQVLYLEALKNYTKIVTNTKTHCVLRSISNLLAETTFKNFIRIHRSYAVQKLFIQSVNTTDVILNNKISLPIGRSYKGNLNAFVL